MSRKEQVFQKYKNEWNALYTQGEELLQDTIRDFSNCDPSGNNKYLEWMIKVATEGGIVSNEEIMETINTFHTHQNGLTKDHVEGFYYSGVDLRGQIEPSGLSPILSKPRDINVYPNLWLLRGTLQFYLTEKNVKKEIKTKSHQYDILLDDENYLIAVPLTYEASKMLGQGTKWCVAAKDTSNHFKSYTETGILYYIIDKIRNDPENPLYKMAYYRKYEDRNGTVFNAPDTGSHDIKYFFPARICNLIDNYHKGSLDYDKLEKILKDCLYVMASEQFKLTYKPNETSRNQKINIPVNVRFVNQSKEKVYIDICNFPDWGYILIPQRCNHSDFSYELQLTHNNKVYNKTTFIEHLNNIKIIGCARGLKNNPNSREILDVFLDSFKRKLGDLTWNHTAIIIYKLFESLCSKIGNQDKWNIHITNKLDDFLSYSRLEFEIKTKTRKGHYGGVRFTFDITFQDKDKEFTNTKTINLSFENKESHIYEWDGFCKEYSIPIKESNLIQMFTEIIQEIQDYIVKTKNKIPIPEPTDISPFLGSMSNPLISNGYNGKYDKYDNYDYDGNFTVDDYRVWKILENAGIDGNVLLQMFKQWKREQI